MNTETKKHIDAARQVLVGVVPNPTSQIDQITNALIYKFMDDMDQSAIKAGGNPSFFVGDLERYAWTRLMDARMGNQERMNLYSEALLKFSQAKQLPELFRGIFKSAFLPYRSPETLGLFLKEISYFDYSHPEELGNAYEYLLSIMSSQGDAGQFRTPRHIIDFIVDVVNPTKDDKVLDPACGTGGFLVSSYKHILAQHDGINDPNKKEKPLTPDQRRNLMNNFEGYDIDPTMVRIAQVNMYLHQFKNPKIFQYDTLSSDERWNDKFDVILANPPFMSPKGGIKPHSKFSIQSSRSEVLFVDYIMNHLRPNGRAGIIVPEGVIFQSGIAYKQLRKNLLEDGLYAVVSLPSGVFNPYAGVKTSILFFDNELSKKIKDILFVKIENDGFDLGAQRRPIEKDDLPDARVVLRGFGHYVNNNQPIEVTREWVNGSHNGFLVPKEKITESGDYNLSIEHYRTVTDYTNVKWPIVGIGELCELGRGRVISKKDIDTNPGFFPVYSSQTTNNGIFGYLGSYDFDGEYVTWTTDGANAGTVFYREGKFNCTNVCGTLKAKTKNVNMKYLAKILDEVAYRYVIQVGNPKLMNNVMAKIKIPLPPIEIQEQIVAELDVFQKVKDGAKQVVTNWKPKIKIDPDWVKTKLGEVCDFVRGPFGGSLKKEIFVKDGCAVYEQSHAINENFSDFRYFIDENKFKEMKRFEVHPGDLIMSCSGTMGKTAILPSKIKGGIINQALLKLTPHKELDVHFLKLWMDSDDFQHQLLSNVSGVAIKNVASVKILQDLIISLPALENQMEVVAKIEEEKNIVEENKKLIQIFEQKIKDKIGEVWGE